MLFLKRLFELLFLILESPKPKKKPKIRKRKVEEISSGMIDSALEEDDNEEAVLKGIESVLDAIDDELDAMDEDSEDEGTIIT